VGADWLGDCMYWQKQIDEFLGSSYRSMIVRQKFFSMHLCPNMLSLVECAEGRIVVCTYDGIIKRNFRCSLYVHSRTALVIYLSLSLIAISNTHVAIIVCIKLKVKNCLFSLNSNFLNLSLGTWHIKGKQKCFQNCIICKYVYKVWILIFA